MIPLGEVLEGEKAEIIDFEDSQSAKADKKHHSENIASRLESMGLRKGKILQMITNTKRGPLLVKVDEHRIALGRGMAMKITVRKIN